MKERENTIFIFFVFAIILFTSLLLYRKPLFSNKPLGLDALGHLSKISYLKEFSLGVRWDLAWYNGAPFLEYYSPLFYWLAYFFNNIIFGVNFLQFLSILFTSFGIFFLINYYSKNKIYSLIFSLFFLSVLCTSYYFISVGNSPYVFGVFTIPFTLFFLEKSLENRKYNILIYSLFFVLAYLIHIFIALALFLLVAIRIVIYCYFNEKKEFVKNLIKEGLIYLIIPILISAFWFFPFLSKSKDFVGDEIGYIPSLSHLFGFGNYIVWGKAPGEIGIIFAVFIASLFFVKKYFKEKNEKIIFLTVGSILFLLLLEGILWKFYPKGIGAIRFILPFSILACTFSGVILSKNFKNNIKIIILLFLLLLVALFLNYNTINENYQKYSYNSNYDRWGLVNLVYSLKEFPLKNNFSNYRFGTSKYIFSETLNYKFPWQSQTWGYFDQGILYPEELNGFRKIVWNSRNLEETLNYFDDYGIKYFEIGGKDLEFDNKFDRSDKFLLVMENNFSDYPFKIYEYKDAKPIISIILNNKSYENYSKYSIERKNPDLIIVEYNFSGEESILFKEFFHTSWKAIDSKAKKIPIIKTKNNFMSLYPPDNTERVIIYQSRTKLEIIGIITSIIGITLSFIIGLSNKRKIIDN
ncbi:MAG: hypothetical protein QW622_02190 [Candidatus Pacearchaeota archaeon]